MSIAKREIELPDSALAATHGYSQCVRSGAFVFIAGQCGTADSWEVVSLEFEPQVRRTLERIREAVVAAGGSMSDIVSLTIFLTDIRQGPEFNRIRLEYFEKPYPTSTIVGVSSLMPEGGLVEVQAIAVITDLVAHT